MDIAKRLDPIAILRPGPRSSAWLSICQIELLSVICAAVEALFDKVLVSAAVAAYTALVL